MFFILNLVTTYAISKPSATVNYDTLEIIIVSSQYESFFPGEEKRVPYLYIKSCKQVSISSYANNNIFLRIDHNFFIVNYSLLAHQRSSGVT